MISDPYVNHLNKNIKNPFNFKSANPGSGIQPLDLNCKSNKVPNTNPQLIDTEEK